MTSYLRLFLTFFLKRWLLLLLFFKQVPATVGLSRLFYDNGREAKSDLKNSIKEVINGANCTFKTEV